MNIIKRMLFVLGFVIAFSLYLIKTTSYAEDIKTLRQNMAPITMAQYQTKTWSIRLYDEHGNNIGAIENKDDGAYFTDEISATRLN